MHGRRFQRKRDIRQETFLINTGKLRCPECDGTGVISLDVQFLPDVEIPCPGCRGSRYAKVPIWSAIRKKRGELFSSGAYEHGCPYSA